MTSKQNILQNIANLTKFAPMIFKQVHYVNCLTSYTAMGEIMQLLLNKTEFVIETKYDLRTGCPKLIQILFSHKLKLHIILVETLYLPDFDIILHNMIRELFAKVLSPSNEIRSWNNIKAELKLFLDCSLFSINQIENIHAVNVQQKFDEWFKKYFHSIKLNNVPSDNWTLDKAIAFLFQQCLDTSLSKSLDWNIGLFAKFDTCFNEKSTTKKNLTNLIKDNERRTILSDFAINECLAVNKIAALVLYAWGRRQGEKIVKQYYQCS